MFKPSLALATDLPASLQNVDWLIHGEAFLRWWLSELAQCVPARWRDIFAREEEPVLQLIYHPRGMAGVDQPYESCQHITPDVSDGLLSLGPGTFHVRRLELPLLASQNMTKAVQFEALRFNPLARSLSAFDYAVVARDFQARRIQIDLFVVRQRALDTAISFARSRGITLQGACVDGEGAPVRLPRLLARSGRPAALSVRQRRLFRRGCVNAAIVFGLMAFLVIRLELAAGAQHARMESMAAIAHASEPERWQLRELALQIEAVNDEQKKSSAIAVLAELTHLLPDSVWLTHFTTSSSGVHIQGLAQRASALIGTLSKSGLLRRVHFAGPIIKDPRQDLEQFDLDLAVDGKAGQ